MQDTATLESKIGFGFIRDRIKNRCSTVFASQRAEEETISSDPEEILRRQRLVDEMIQISIMESKFPQGGFTDCTGFLPALKKESSAISVENMKKLSDFMGNLRGVTAFLNSTKEEKYPFLKALALPVQYYPAVTARIDSILDKNGMVRDTASAELHKISSELRQAQSSVSRRIESLLKKAKADNLADEDATISVRDGKMLIPVNATSKRSIPGIVQDASASGKTFFIEPMEVVELNNRIRRLTFDRQREITRILLEFTDFLRPYIPELMDGARFIGEVDFIRAKAECAGGMRAGIPVLSEDGSLRIYEGRHPLLESALTREGKKIVPTDLTLTRDKHILVISGPNAGGKSVALKTVGILQYMFQWGMPTSCNQKSEFPVFDNILIDIGDQQSMENDLSTYSSHLLNMRNLLKAASSRTLVLIDEFGSGTEPAAGGAIAQTILEELEERGTYGVITTHYTNLKVYAEGSKGVINGAMLFDSVNIAPLYKLEIGVPGNSFAFDLARKMGLPEHIVKKAEEKAGEDFIDLEKQLRTISRNRRKLDEKLARIKNTDKTLESVTEKYSKELSEIRQTKKQIIEEAKEEAKRIIAEANRKVESTIKKIKEAQAEKEATKQARQALKDAGQKIQEGELSDRDRKIEAKMKSLQERKERQAQRKARRENQQPETRKEEPKKLTLEVGAKVKVEGSGLIGEVLKIEGKNVTISLGDITSRVKKDSLTVISNKEFQNQGGAKPVASPRNYSINIDESISKRKLSFKDEIDIRGQRLDEALVSVSKFIDDATLVGASKVRILHGKGTGVLKEEIRKFLKTNPSVASCKDEDVRLGGAGITVVSLN
ncbi:MAG: Smr/MutS family protein [Bacteroidales bacterium]|nr:Smr/MutS family protein [Bacteroidales bacterium]